LIPDGHLAAKVFIVNTESTTGSTDGLVLRVRSERRTFDEDGNCEEGRSTTPPPIIYSLSLTEWPVPDRYTYLRIDYPPSNGIEHKINASLFGDFIVSDLYKKFALIVRDRENAGQYVSLEWQIVDGSVVGPAISDILTSNTLEYDLAETSGSIRERITTVLDAGYNAQGVLTFVKVDTDCLVEYSESGNIRENTRTHKVRMYGPGFDESAENTSYMTRDLATQDREYSARTYTTILLIGANYSLERFHIARSVLEIEAHTEDNYDYVDKDHGIRLDELAPIDGPALITGTTDVLRIDRGVETIETTGNCTTSSWYEYSQNLDFNSYAEDPLRGEISRSDVDIVQITEDREEGNTLFGMGHPQFTNPQGFETDAGWESIIFEDYAGAVVEYVPYHLNPNDWDHTGKFMYFQYFDPDGTPYDMSIVEDALWSGPPPSQDSLRNMPTYTVGLEYRAP
jgi:hypothetical protein